MNDDGLLAQDDEFGEAVDARSTALAVALIAPAETVAYGCAGESGAELLELAPLARVEACRGRSREGCRGSRAV